MNNLEEITSEQNKKIDRLISAIKESAEIRAEGTNSTMIPFIPKWLKITILIIGGVIAFSCSLFVTMTVLSYFS
jgi:hypothetical protein